MKVLAFAKINWTLAVTGVRDDGYHLLDMLMQPVSLWDTITLIPAGDLSLTTGGMPLLPADEHHLAWKAACLLKRVTGFPGGASIHVEKSIPVQAGLGGGSADAAGTLAGLNRLWKTGLTQQDLEEIGLELGADVPFCLRGGLCRTRGIGEKLESCSCDRFYSLLILQPCGGLSTGEVFRAWHSSPVSHRADNQAALQVIREGNTAELDRCLFNELQAVSEKMEPAVALCIRDLKACGAQAALMTGSGSAVFGVFSDDQAAEAASKLLSGKYGKTFLCHTRDKSVEIHDE